MIAAPVVVDASVALSYVWQEHHRHAAQSLFAAGLKGRVQLVAPELWSLECANGCWRRNRRGLASPAHAREAVRLIEDLPVTRIDVSHLAPAAFELALLVGITAYDALYVVTTDYVGGQLLTADEKLLYALRRARWPTAAGHIADYR